MRDLDLTTLRLFVAVCDSRSIARAGEQANIVGSAISKRLAQLEDTVGTPLLLRKRRGVVPTPAGETLLEHARAMLGSATRIERDMAAYAGGARGHVRILASASVMAESLAEDVAGFLQDPAHRNIRVDMEERVSPEIVRGIREGIASIGLCWDAADLDGLQTVPYGTDHLAVIAYPGHPLADLKTVRFEDTLGFDHVGLPASTAVHSMLARVAAMSGTVLSYRSIVTTFEAELRVVRAELGISVVPKEIAQTFAASMGLRIIPLEDAWARRTFAICFRDAASLSPAAKMLVDHLAERARVRSLA